MSGWTKKPGDIYLLRGYQQSTSQNDKKQEDGITSEIRPSLEDSNATIQFTNNPYMQQPPYNPFYKSNEKVIDEIKLIEEDVTKRIKRNTKCTLGNCITCCIFFIIAIIIILVFLLYFVTKNPKIAQILCNLANKTNSLQEN
ncbi:hypothetical protein HZU73_07123 [Apis mellifera caucasica]|uniref:Uncharacterized protein LOC725818 isoform X1 n=1 Tax=Apis mellifera TaxID=7460 RepID=A0A7M7IP12_APIME|nr:uncharacterized protein LOC725818 isoform X1 [Apis mellifera]XP_006570205.1 uncharacterized protein LOC725818 isoform X1 [Apis mellifera]XP_016773428.1 uncharacterized protein LOC725818 isoform X1 [Apis mellifera]XP_016773429.1 uncharacterized protein LOC725818 isoform X1 [Apis mellifera]XP_026296112.1 uncharacterized protein LOC725818 isoform X1 [Apis mellifera]KAG6797803.1 hypothetical protein HZU73_07123 [Apis mellifera caucasica]KAG9437656.1 hypothetical protein HZU67_00665 [Apis melli|eukprot:XP_006570204.1 uncharacterized protein LOC725818 isoform X1 [Apis mellifera]